MYGPYNTKVAVGASVALYVGLAFFFPAGAVACVPLALSSASLLVCGEDFRAADDKKIRRARMACAVATVLNVPLFFFILWLMAAQTPLWLMALFAPLASLMQVHQVSMGLKGLSPRTGLPHERMQDEVLEKRAAASYARNPAIRDASPVRTGGVKHLPDRWGWIGLLIWAPLAVCGTLVFLRGEFTASYGTKAGMMALLLLSVLYAAYVFFGRMRRGLALRLSRTTWLGMTGMGATIVLGPFLLLLPALYGGAYVSHRAVAGVHTEDYEIKVQQGRGRYRNSHYAVVGEGIKVCFRPLHADIKETALTADIDRSPLGASASAYYLGGMRYETACSPRMLPSPRA
ncbi:MAG TPA: hypothetical protein PLW48_02420 [Alphaproteobacteria bacterium]|nr:hypothetical protein [Rhodospirillaceae bacterium]HRJ65964.1 hypothetical protein [Alphaproteobacteria bacterium]